MKHVFVLFDFILVHLIQYAVESQIRLRGFDPSKSMVLLKPRKVKLPFSHIFTSSKYIYKKKTECFLRSQ